MRVDRGLVARVAERLPAALRTALGPPRPEGALVCFAAGDVEVVAPGSDAAADRLVQEVAFVRRLGDAAPVPMPGYQELLPDERLPIAIRLVAPGRRAGDPPGAAAATELGRLVAWLATLAADAALEAGVRVRAASWHNFARLYRDAARLYGDVRPILDDLTRRRCDRLLSLGMVPQPRNWPATVVHGRLGRGLVWLDPATGGVTCVTGWGAVGFGDVAVSLFRLHQWGGAACVDAALAGAPDLDAEVRERVRFLSRTSALFDLHAARAAGDARLAEQSLRALRWE